MRPFLHPYNCNLERNKFKNAEIHHLRLAFEEVTGQDLNWFFNQWFMAKGHPILNVSQTYNADKKTIELTVEQTQNFDIAPLYRLPVSVDVYVDGKVQKQTVVIEDAKQTFTFTNINSTPDLVNFDPERQLLCVLNYVRSIDALIYQYQHASSYSDRADALKLLKEHVKEERVLAVFKTAAEKDASFHIRLNAIRVLEGVATEKEADLKPVLLRITNADKTNLVRAEALGFIAKYYKSTSELPTLIEKGLNDPSYAVEAEALQALIDKDPVAAMQKAKQFENETGKGLLNTVAGLYSTNGGDEQLAFFGNNLKNYGGFELIGFLGNYARFAKRSSSSIVAITAARDFESIAKSGNKFSKMGAVKSIKDLAGIWETKFTSLKQAGATGTEAEKKLKEVEETKDILKKLYEGVK